MRHTTCAIAVLLGSVPFVTVPQLPPRAQSPPVTFPSCNVDAQVHHGARPPRSVYVPMRDGVRIALEIVLPDGIPEGTRLPTILSMTRYWRAEEGGGPRVSQSGEPQFWLSHGYALVVGDVRGTGASFGVWRHHRSRDETLDFSEIVDWIIAQPWSDQQVVGFGVSYSANTADWMAERNHPALKAIVSRSPDYDPYADLYFPGGIPNAYMGRVWGLSVKEMDLNVKVQHPDGARGIKPVDGSDGPRLLQQAIDARRDIPSVWEGLRRIVYRDDRPQEWAGWSMDDWGIHGWRNSVEQSRVPIQSWGSWMDAGTANGVLHRFMTLSNPQHVFVGAWSHGGGYDADPYRPNDASADPPLEMQWLEDLCFVETHLQGRPGTAHSPERLLTYFTMGEERWKTTTTWPPPGTEDRSWYFAAGRTLVTTKPTNREGADRYTVDFEATTGTTNRWATNNTGEDVRYPSRRTADRRLLTYTSLPLPDDIEITGQPSLALNVASTHKDGAFFVYLEDVAPDGTVRYLTEGELRAIHRRVSNQDPPYRVVGPYHSFKHEDALPLVPRQITEISFELMPVSVLVRAGHRLRVAVAGADADTFRRIPDEGVPTVAVYHSAAHPSRIVLPVMRQ